MWHMPVSSWRATARAKSRSPLNTAERGAQDANIYASTFESLRDRGFPIVGLDQSFRLHRAHTEFLENHVSA
jgi:hypothetical protein